MKLKYNPITGELDLVNNGVDSIQSDGVTGVISQAGSGVISSYGVCDTAADTAAKTATIGGSIASLDAGVRVSIKFTHTNTAANPTLSINGSRAHNIICQGSPIDSSTAGMLAGVCNLVYDGSAWNLTGYSTAGIDLSESVEDIIAHALNELNSRLKALESATAEAIISYLSAAIESSPRLGDKVWKLFVREAEDGTSPIDLNLTPRRFGDIYITKNGNKSELWVSNGLTVNDWHPIIVTS